jgi:hypothetical protein
MPVNKKSNRKKKHTSTRFSMVLNMILLLFFGIFIGSSIQKSAVIENLVNKFEGIKNVKEDSAVSSIDQDSPEIRHILALQRSKDQEPHLVRLLDRIGPEATQEKLVKSGLPFTGETHLLVHTIGKYIYEKYGSAGLKMCKDYFLSACFHAFIIEDLSDNGISGLINTMNDCKKVGIHVFSQCVHAAGHGFVVWNDYDLVTALYMCDELIANTENAPSFHCYDGVFMENLFSVHEGKLSDKRWINDSDPYYPCNDPRIPEKYLPGCWGNQASLMYKMYHGDLKKVALGCDGVANPKHQEKCYDNFARQIHPDTVGKSEKAFELCKNATGKRWQNFCLTVLVGASFSVGDRTKMPYEICKGMPDGREKRNCYIYLFGLISYSEKDKNKATSYCKNVLEEDFKRECVEFQNKPNQRAMR